MLGCSLDLAVNKFEMKNFEVTAYNLKYLLDMALSSP